MYLVHIRFSMRTRFEKCIFPRFDLFWYININLRLLCTCKCKHRSFKIKLWIESFALYFYTTKKTVLIAIKKYGIRFDIRIFKTLSFNIFCTFQVWWLTKNNIRIFIHPVNGINILSMYAAAFSWWQSANHFTNMVGRNKICVIDTRILSTK